MIVWQGKDITVDIEKHYVTDEPLIVIKFPDGRSINIYPHAFPIQHVSIITANIPVSLLEMDHDKTN